MPGQRAVLAVGCACGVLLGVANPGTTGGRPADSGTREHGESGGVTITATAHAPLPRDASLLWLAPSGQRPAAHPGTLSQYTAYHEARAQLGRGGHAVARRQFAAILASGPTGYLREAASLGAAEAAFASKDFAAAQNMYERLLADGPASADVVWFRLGESARAAGNRTRAVAAFGRVHEQFPMSRHAAAALSALTEMGVLTPLGPDNARYAIESRRAELLIEAKRYAEARPVLERLRRHASETERGRIDVRSAACSYYAKQYAAARAVLRPYVDGGPMQEEAQFLDLMSAHGMGEHIEFERSAREFIDRFGRGRFAAEILDTLGTYYIQRDRDEDADTVFRRVLELFPGSRFAERAAWKVGWRSFRRGNAADAARVFERAAATFPRSDYRPAYLYWAARAHALLGQREGADSRYAVVRADYLHSYYGRLADTALAGRDVPARASFDVTAASTGPAPGIGSAPAPPPTAHLIRLLLSAGRYDDATSEIRHAQHRWGDSPMLQATLGWIEHQKGDLLAGARAARRAYPQHLSARGGELPSELASLMFPLGYWSLLREQAARHQIDPYLLAALVAQESGFIPDIKSPASATGLMQLMPATAQRYARRLALGSFSPAQLREPETNVRLGAAYFADLLREFGDTHLALASYNAGESRVRRWLADRRELAADEFIDDIPFPETQNYVKKVLGAAENYRRIYGGKASFASDPDRRIPSLASRRSAAAPAPAVSVPQQPQAQRARPQKPSTPKPARPGRPAK